MQGFQILDFSFWFSLWLSHPLVLSLAGASFSSFHFHWKPRRCSHRHAPMINISCKGTNTEGNKTLYRSVNDWSKRSVSAPSANRPFPRFAEPLFQREAKCESINMTMVFYFHANKIHFRKKGFAFSHVLKVRVFGTRRWSIKSCDALSLSPSCPPFPPPPTFMRDDWRDKNGCVKDPIEHDLTTRGGHSTKFYTGRFRPGVQPLSHIYAVYDRKRYPFCIASIDEWYPFHIHSLELCILLTTIKALYLKYHKPQNQNVFSSFSQSEITSVSPFRSLRPYDRNDRCPYPSTDFNCWSSHPFMYLTPKKKVSLPGGASPFRP